MESYTKYLSEKFNCKINSDAMRLCTALSGDIFIGKRFSKFPDAVLEEISRYESDNYLFLNCSPLELDVWLSQDKIFASVPRLCHHITALEKYNCDGIFGIKIKKNKNIMKIGCCHIVAGKLSNFSGAVESIICDPVMISMAEKISKKYGNFLHIHTVRKFIKTSKIFEVNIEKLGINERVEASTPQEALSGVLESSWKNSEQSNFFRRVPSDFIADNWMPFIGEIVKEAKVNSAWPPKLGSLVRARPSNGMPGGKIGTVVSHKNRKFVVDFNGHQMEYDLDNPRTLTQIDTDLT